MSCLARNLTVIKMLNEIKENTNRKLNEIRKMMHKQYENVNKEIETMKKNQTEKIRKGDNC